MSFRILCCVFLEMPTISRISKSFGRRQNWVFRLNVTIPFVFEWKIFLGHTTAQLLQEIQHLTENELRIQPQNLEDRIIFMSIYNDIDWTAKDNTSRCLENSSQVSDNAKKFSLGHWTFLGPGDENKWYGTLTHKPMENGNRTAEQMMLNFAESGYPVFRGTSLLARGLLKSRGGGGGTVSNTLQRGTSNSRTVDSYSACSQSAQYLRSSGVLVQRPLLPSNETPCRIQILILYVCSEKTSIYCALQGKRCVCFGMYVGTLMNQRECPGNHTQVCGGSDVSSFHLYYL